MFLINVYIFFFCSTSVGDHDPDSFSIFTAVLFFYLVDFFTYSLHVVSLHPLSRDGESQLLILQLQVVIDALQETVHTGQLDAGAEFAVCQCLLCGQQEVR